MSCTSLFIGHTYIDVTLLADHWPTGDEKSVASDYAVSFGGNAVTAAFACAKLGSAPDLICSMAPDWLGHMYADMAAAHGVALHTRQVRRSSLSCIMPNHGKRAIVRARDADYLNDFPAWTSAATARCTWTAISPTRRCTTTRAPSARPAS